MNIKKGHCESLETGASLVEKWTCLILSFLQTNTDTCANSVDPDEKRLVTSQDLHYLPVTDFRQKPFFARMDVSKFSDGIIHLRNSGVKELSF